MAKEKFIRGKKDDADHVGLRHNRRAEEAADYHLLCYLNGDFDDLDDEEPKKRTKRKK